MGQGKRLVLFRFRLTGSRRYQPVCIPYRHENPTSHRPSASNDDAVSLAELVEMAANMPLKPPVDQSVKTLCIRRLNSSVLEQDIRDYFCTYGEIESIRFFTQREVTCAFLTYTTRQAAEKATLERSGWVDINGQRLRLLWGPDQDTCNRTLARSALLPQQQRMDPQRIDSVISTQEVGGSSSSENHGVSSSSSYQMPPQRIECEDNRRKIMTGLINDGPQQQRNDAVISTQELGGSSSSENHGASSYSSSYQMPPYPQNERRKMLFRYGLTGARRYQPVCIPYETGRQCTSGDKCPFRHENPIPHRRSASNDNAVRLAELVEMAGNMPLKPPEDQSVKTLYIRRLNSSVLEQDIRDYFCTYGEVESIRFFVQREVTCAFLTYTTRQAAEKATLERSSWVVINGQRLILLWGPDQDTCNCTLARSALLPQQQRMDPQRIDSVFSTQEVGGSSSSENRGASSSSSSYQMPPQRIECEDKRRIG